jgi:hypothetical protein
VCLSWRSTNIARSNMDMDDGHYGRRTPHPHHICKQWGIPHVDVVFIHQTLQQKWPSRNAAKEENQTNTRLVETTHVLQMPNSRGRYGNPDDFEFVTVCATATDRKYLHLVNMSGGAFMLQRQLSNHCLSRSVTLKIGWIIHHNWWQARQFIVGTKHTNCMVMSCVSLITVSFQTYLI